jgi:hypothetical protein
MVSIVRSLFSGEHCDAGPAKFSIELCGGGPAETVFLPGSPSSAATVVLPGSTLEPPYSPTPFYTVFLSL